MHIDILCIFVASIPTPLLHFLLSENCEESVGNGGVRAHFSGIYERSRLGKRCPSVGPWGFDIYMTKEASTLLGHWFVET